MTISATTVRPRPTLTALRAAHLFDGTGTLPNPTVIIDGATILAAGRGLAVPDGAQVINLPGATILPGLVDAHVHLVFDASDDPIGRLTGRDDAAVFAAAAAAARRAAQGGVTTVRDLGDRGFLVLGLRDAARTDQTLPHILAAGPPITTPGGHCHFLGASAAGADGVRAAIRERADRGADVIKIMASGGNMTPGSRPELAQYTRDELRAAVTEAHRHGLAITAHAHGTSAITDAVAAGMDGLEHVSFMTADGVDEIPGELLATLGRGELVLSLTFGIAQVSGAAPPPGVLVPPQATFARSTTRRSRSA
jgi:imidazolonepropionase-like amidohydrolase